MEPGGVDQKTAADRGRLIAAGGELEAAGAHTAGEDRSAQHHNRTGALSLALISEHQRMAVDNAGRGRQ